MSRAFRRRFKEEHMASYIVLGQFTDQGIRNVKDTTKRAQTLKDSAKKFGATVTSVYWTLGQYDVAAIVEAPDDASLNGLLLTLGSLGNVRSDAARVHGRRDDRDPRQGGVAVLPTLFMSIAAS
jgi:uncharacterized protein with GYD domain